MKLIINKFPPITQRSEIDLSKNLTLFVGENNSWYLDSSKRANLER